MCCNKRVLRVTSVALFILNFTLLTSNLVYAISKVPSSASVSFTVHLIYAINVTLAITDVLVLSLCLVFRSGINGIFQSLEVIDQLLRDVNIQMTYPRIKRRNTGILILIHGINALQIVVAVIVNPKGKLRGLHYPFRLFYEQFFHYSFAVLIIAVVKSIEWRFRALNVGMEVICTKRLMEEKETSALMCLRGVIRKPTKETIFKFAILHKKLCQTLPLIGGGFGIQVLLLVAF